MGENLAPMFLYVSNNAIALTPMEPGQYTCPSLLMFAPKDSAKDLDPQWELVWSTNRFTDIKGMELRYYGRKDFAKNQNRKRLAMGEVLKP